MALESRWYFQLFGGFEARCGTRRVNRLRTAKTVSLLGYLITHPPHRFPREALAELFWQDMEPGRARNNLSVALNAIRYAFEAPEPAPPLLIAEPQSVGLNRAAFDADVLDFADAIALAQQASDPSAQYQYYLQAVRLYTGEFLAGYYDLWIVDAGVQFQLQYSEALKRLTEIDLQQGNRVQAIEWLHRLVALHPTDAEPLCTLVGLYLDEGRPEPAYQVCSAWIEQYQREQRRRAPMAVQRLLLQCQQLGSRRAVLARRSKRARSDKPDLTAPALPTTPRVETGAPELPQPTTPLFGRQTELQSLLNLLQRPETRCVSILGLGGVGKTRLAIAVAQQLAGSPERTVLWVPLAGILNPEQMGEAILAALGVSVAYDPLEQAIHCLRQLERVVLVLDNMEQLLPEASAIIARLLESVPYCQMLITSRVPLTIDAEIRFHLEPLACSDAPECPALQLFVHRAQQVAQDFRLTEQNRNLITALCQSLDGIPLALELAASRVNVLSPRQMLEQVSHRLSWLKTHRVDIPARHREMRTVLKITCASLPADAQKLLRQMAVVPAAWSADTLREIFYTEAPADSLLESLESLLGAGLIQRVAANGAVLFRMLEVVREHALEQMTPDEQRACRSQIAAWVCAQADARRAQSRTEQLPQWLAFWDAHRECLQDALQLLLEQGQTETLFEVIVSLDRYFLARCVLPWVEVFLTQAIQLPNGTSLMRCRLLRLLTGVYFKRESFETSRALAHEMLALAETLPESPETLGWALYWVVQHALTERDWATVHHYWERLWSMYPCHEDFELHIQIHYLAGYIPWERQPPDWRERAVREAFQQPDLLVRQSPLSAYSEELTLRGDYEKARLVCLEEVQLARQLDDPIRVGSALVTQLFIAIQQGELESAEALLHELRQLDLQVGRFADTLLWLEGHWRLRRGEPEQALQAALELVARHLPYDRPHELGGAWDLAALAAIAQGDLPTALRYAENALDARRQQEDAYRLHFSKTHYYGIRAMLQPDPEAAQALEACLVFWQEREARPWQANTLYYLAHAYKALGDLPRAKSALEEAIQLNQAMGRQIALQQCRALADEMATF